MTRLYSARPNSKHVVISPGDDKAVVLGDRRACEMPIAATRPRDWNRNAPVVEFSERFKAAMRAKGWLRQ